MAENDTATLAAALQTPPQDTIFAKFVRGDIKPNTVYENEHVLAFHDINPQAPVHVIVIPKTPVGGLRDVTEAHAALMGQLFVAVPHVARVLNLDEGYRVVVNDGPHGGQSVHWLHVHILGRRHMRWPPG